MTKQERIAALLATGLSAARVATIVGCSPSYISQLQKDTNFTQLVENESLKLEEKNIEETTLKAKLLAAEHALIDQVLTMAPSAELRDVTNALRAVGERQDKMHQRTNPVHAGNVTVHQNIVQLALPVQAVPRFIANTDNQIIAIGDQTLAPMTSEAVENLFKKMNSTQELEHVIIEGEHNEPERFPASSSSADPETISAAALSA